MVFKKGDIVVVDARMGPGENNPGGVARVASARGKGAKRKYDVKYIVGRSSEKGVEAKFVSAHSLNAARTPAKKTKQASARATSTRKPRARKRSPSPKKKTSKSPTPQKRRSRSATPKKSATKRRSKTPTPKKSTTKKGSKSPAPKKASTPHFEFGGPFGALMTTLSLPCVVVGLWFACTPEYCLDFDVSSWTTKGWEVISAQFPSSADALFDATAFAVVAGWMAFQVALERLLPATIVQGAPVGGSAKRLDYRINGHAAFWVSIISAVLLHMHVDGFDLTYCYDSYLQLAVASIVISSAGSVALYAASFREGAEELAHGGNTGYAIYDFFIGRELNPRIAGTTFDFKFFCELRPGLIGWTVINLGCAFAQAEKQGELSVAMILVNFGQGLYVWDALFHETCILTTMDIINDGFGFMLAFGDLAWVPFTYSLQARYLVFGSGVSSALTLALLFALNVAGYTIFRKSNAEKDAFRRDPEAPEVSHLEYIQTKYKGRRLLTSGWWGAARKINYTGDWMMGLAWCAYCGCDAILPYFYAIYFFILLAHRAMRDDEQCGAKYGKSWEEYKRKVPYIFVPGFV